MECDANGRGSTHSLQGHEGSGEAGVAPLHRGVRCRVSSARVGYGSDWCGNGEGRSFLDVVSLLLVFLPFPIFNLLVVFQSSCLEVWLDAKEVYAFNWLWW